MLRINHRIKSLDEMGDEMVFSLLKTIWKEGSILTESENSKTVPIYKQKGDPLDCGSYRGIKLLEHDVRTAQGRTKAFEINVGLHQG